MQWYYFIFILTSAYVCHSVAVIFGKIMPIYPVDCYKTIRGKRFFGDHKTIGGLFFGVLFGGFIGAVVVEIVGMVIHERLVPEHYIWICWYLAWFSMMGDLAGSFVKRQIGLKPGDGNLVLDVFPFVLFTFAALVLIDYDMMVNKLTWRAVVLAIVVTPILHRSTNYIAYKLKYKPQPV